MENVRLGYDISTLSVHSPFFVVTLDCAEDAKRLIRRSILIREIVELWNDEPSMDALLESVKGSLQPFEPFRTSTFKFLVQAFGKSLTPAEQVKRIERFSFLPLEGEINLKDPAVTFCVYEDYGDYAVRGIPAPTEGPERACFGLLVATGSRSVVARFDLKKREYLGNTSMDAELSLLMANQALVKTGSFVLDPFVGTGSFLVTSAHFGAFALGSDIDGRQIRGKGDKSVKSIITQYEVEGRLVHHPWREIEFWDAIICDPPYGVRAGAKKIGRNEKLPAKTTFVKANGEMKVPQSVPYELDEVILDLIDFAAKHLVPKGRLVFWLPTIPDEYEPDDIPKHRRVRLIANSEQYFGKWARRLITMEKLSATEPDMPYSASEQEVAHARFRRKYFNLGQYLEPREAEPCNKTE
ncbi:hypothetical protein HK101_003848 [Irineochytrium annulatum]|nr:hypothetical protein HK101_003848 [Irineochytrium annulatum]